MANPKRRQSHSRGRKRRSHDALKEKDLGLCPFCNHTKLPHTVCANCGQYKGRQVVEKD